LDKNFLTYDQFKSTRFKYQTHSQAIYTSRFLNFSKLSKP
ncbi:5003_t:CDS:1, partial [Cetraspora pellucida]